MRSLFWGLLGFTILMSFVAWADIGELFVPPSTGPGVRLVDMPAPLLALNLALCALPVVAFVLILAGVAGTIAEAGISVRQVIVDDPEVSDDPHAFIVTEQPVPERLLPRIKAVEGVKSVVLY